MIILQCYDDLLMKHAAVQLLKRLQRLAAVAGITHFANMYSVAYVVFYSLENRIHQFISCTLRNYLHPVDIVLMIQ